MSVVTKNPSGWYYVEMGDKEGWVPSSYLERVSDPAPTEPTFNFTSKSTEKSSTSRSDSMTKSSSVGATAAALAAAASASKASMAPKSSSTSKVSGNKSTSQQSSWKPAGTKPPPPARRPTRSDNNVTHSATRSSLKRSSSTDSLLERTQPQAVTRSHSPPLPRQNRGPPKPAARKTFSNQDDSANPAGQKKFLRKSTENLLASFTAEEKTSTIKGTLSPPQPAPRRNTASPVNPRPAARSFAASPTPTRTANRPKPPPPTRKTSADKPSSSTGSTLKVSSELQNALQGRLHSVSNKQATQNGSSPSTGRKGPPRPSPPSANKGKPEAPSRPQPPAASATLNKKTGPPRPANNPTLSRKPAFVTIADYTSDDPSSLSFKDGETVEVIEKNEDGWWYVNIKGKEGWVPSTFIEAASPKPPRPSPPTIKRQQPQQSSEDSAVAVAAYKPLAGEDSGITLVKGRSYKVVTKNEGGWWFVKYGSQEGWAPSSYLESY